MRTNLDADRLRAYVKEFAKTMQCNCDLDAWEPDKRTGHSHVCRIHQAAINAERYGDERHAFTLVELLVVVTIIAILITPLLCITIGCTQTAGPRFCEGDLVQHRSDGGIGVVILYDPFPGKYRVRFPRRSGRGEPYMFQWAYPYELEHYGEDK